MSVEVETQGRVTLVTLHRPDVRNAVRLVAVVGDRARRFGQAACRMIAAHGEPVGIARGGSGVMASGCSHHVNMRRNISR